MMDNRTRLAYLKAMGVDVWVSRDSDALHIPTAAHKKPDVPGELTSVDDGFGQQAVETCESGQWQNLRQRISECKACELCHSRTQTVFGSGDSKADWMLIGEAPGFHEDQEGLPFVGRAGSLLTEMLRAIGLNRDQVFIANILKCRPPDNRDPKAAEVEACAEHLQQQIDWVQPKIILALGRFAAQNLLKSELSIGKLRGSVHHLQDIPVIVIYHPAYLLRSLTEKRKAWDDLKLALKVYKNIA